MSGFFDDPANVKWFKTALAELNNTLGDLAERESPSESAAMIEALQGLVDRIQPAAAAEAPTVIVQPAAVHVEIRENATAQWEFTPDYHPDGRIRKIAIKRTSPQAVSTLAQALGVRQ